MLKKITYIVLSIVMIFSICACSASETAVKTADTSATAQTSQASASAATASGTVTAPEFPELTVTYTMDLAETSVDAQGVLKMRDYIAEKTGGKVKMDCYFSSSLFPQDEEMTQLLKDNLDMTHLGLDFLPKMRPEVYTLGVPFLFQNKDHFLSWWNSDEARTYLDQVAEEEDVYFFSGMGYRGVRTVNLATDKKITCRADLEGKKLRMPNTESYIFMGECLGANPIPLAFSEVYLALQTGSVDGQDNAISTTIGSSFQEVTKSITITGHMIGSMGLAIRYNLWQTFSPELQQIFNEGAQICFDYITNTVLSEEDSDIANLEKQGLSVYELTDDEKAAYAKECQDYYFANGGKVDQTLFDQIQKYA